MFFIKSNISATDIVAVKFHTNIAYWWLFVTQRYWRCSDVKVRLSGINSTAEGRLEVYYDGRWGTVCDDEFTFIDAGIVCSSLGFGFVLFSVVIPSSQYNSVMHHFIECCTSTDANDAQTQSAAVWPAQSIRFQHTQRDLNGLGLVRAHAPSGRTHGTSYWDVWTLCTLCCRNWRLLVLVFCVQIIFIMHLGSFLFSAVLLIR